MDLNFNLYLNKAENELKLAEIILKLSENKEIQLSIFKISQPDTYFSSVISHSYYCIFYSAKAYLLKKNIKTKPPEEHKKTYNEFANFVKNGVLDKELLLIYEDAIVKAENLLEIFKTEKKKRGEFTYQKLPQANRQPASESLENARKFFKIIYNLLKLEKFR